MMQVRTIDGRRALLSVLLLIALLGSLAGCSKDRTDVPALEQDPAVRSAVSDELTYRESMKLSYAKQFAVDYYEEGSCLITTLSGRRYFVGDVPSSGLPAGITVLKAPVDRVYMAGTATMDMFLACGGLDKVRFSSLRAGDWKLPEAAAAMEDGSVLYAGKYSAPDYELLKNEKCGLALENTMIYHSPAVIEKLEQLGIPVFVDEASREGTPEARMEWVKVYGLLTGQEKAAENAFRAQIKAFPKEKTAVKDRPAVAFFSLRSNGTVSVRRATDYVPYMIDLAGGDYVFSDLGADDPDANRSTQVISMEEFFTRAKTADYLIYNSTIGGEVPTLKALLQDAPVLKDCPAVKAGRVYCTTADLYQHSMSQGTFVKDLHSVLTGSGEDLTFLFALN